ncbi:hypothetical protein E2562_001963 [Oryza meyeriana var. granulata]|uniref:Uncharacterized protein n=1 Tax=Oryza meyeriana var. granulata TaxID=110450 RepID=A0A6G1C3A0_9ORYZ|nr:hypothetical protein E2562_001963 [Oryza meyeriana var. granulata]
MQSSEDRGECQGSVNGGVREGSPALQGIASTVVERSWGEADQRARSSGRMIGVDGDTNCLYPNC